MRRLSPLVLAMFLSACSTTPWGPFDGWREPPPPAEKPKPPKARKKPPAATAPAQQQAPAQTTTPGQPAAPTGETPTVDGPPGVLGSAPAASVAPTPFVTPASRLKGLDERRVESLLGPPDRREERPPARVWSYESPRCRLELSLYMDVASQTFRVLTHDLRSKGGQPVGGIECLNAASAASQ